MLIEMTSQNSDGSGYLFEGYEKAEGYNSGESSDETDLVDFLTEDGGVEADEFDFQNRTYPHKDESGNTEPNAMKSSHGKRSTSLGENDDTDYTPVREPSSYTDQRNYPEAKLDNYIQNNNANTNTNPAENSPSKSLMIFKRGDDLRQDYVVQTMFFLFNRIWALSPMRYKPFIHQYKYEKNGT